MNVVPFRRRALRIHRRFREARMMARAFRLPYQPVVAHLIPTRRCNLACAYCSEYDQSSDPVPAPVLERRVGALAALGTGIVTMSGGEPLLHPDLDAIIGRVRGLGMMATVITNGYPLTRDRIARLNRAGLDHLQISIDNVTPDQVSRKSLAVLDEKLQLLARWAEFDVTVNATVGGEAASPEDALVIARRALALGFSSTAGIIHDRGGEMRPLSEPQRQVLEAIANLGTSPFDFSRHSRFQRNLTDGRPNDWQCRAGCRYLYVCEDGLVHWCSQQRGRPGVPLERYSQEDLEREHRRVKPCAPRCAVGCVHRVAQLDELREDPAGTLEQWFGQAPGGRPGRLPRSVRFLLWVFVGNRQRQFFRNAAMRMFGIK
jgi:MoaA/NifB/PqqE/SkfB family radical SAM enzyme